MITPVTDIKAFLKAQNEKDSLRFITCGSVDDGKSTLLGRILYDSKAVFEDQLSSTQVESKKYGTQGDQVDLALLVDGLQAEREQGITIDVAYQYFETDKRKFIAADTPGHEQYTRNMATGASTADLAIILIDARKGVLDQTRRHSYIASLLGIGNVVLAVNKMDLMDYSQTVFNKIVKEYHKFAEVLGIENITSIPICALDGDNVFHASSHMTWYDAPPLMTHLEKVEIKRLGSMNAFRMPVQWINRPNLDFRGFSGTIVSGSINKGDEVTASITGLTSTVTKILGPRGSIDRAQLGQSVTFCLADELDISRGDMLASGEKPEVADQLAAHIIWMGDEELLPERTYAIRFATAIATARIVDLVHRIDINSHEHLAAKTLELNEVGYCKLALDRAVPFDPYRECKETGSFVLIDKFTNATVGAGMIEFSLRRASSIEWHEMRVNKEIRAKLNNQKPRVIWLTGLSGSGKSTIADCIEEKLHAMGKRTYLLDGDNVRHGLNKDLGFTDHDRVENIRRVAEVSKLMIDAGLIVITSFISPFRSERRMARDLMEAGEFVEVFVDTPLAICEARDPKGLYKNARTGDLKNFTGIDSTYEPPENAEIVLAGEKTSAEELADQVIEYLAKIQ